VAGYAAERVGVLVADGGNESAVTVDGNPE
jgi:hypothetical protein